MSGPSCQAGIYRFWKQRSSFQPHELPMPTVMRIGGFRFFFYSNENDEPRHIHVKDADHEAKYWLEPLELAWNRGFNTRELG
jgi:hypothetical protein